MEKNTVNAASDFVCPKCGCTHTTRIPAELLGEDVKQLWWCIAVLLALGVAVHPLILLLALAAGVLSVIVGILSKLHSRFVWDMQCPRCGHEFSVPSPDVEAKAAARQTAQKARAAARLVETKQRFADESYNGQLLESEKLLCELSGLGYHRNAFSTVPCKVKCTDHGLLFYNAGGSFRIVASEIVSIRKLQYFGLIPTGIRIKTKRRHYDFVAESGVRDDAIASMETALHHGIFR